MFSTTLSLGSIGHLLALPSVESLVVVPHAGGLPRLVVHRHVRHIAPLHDVLEYIFTALLGANEFHIEVAVEGVAEELAIGDDILVREDD